jgi:hypothetical protein
MQTAMRELEKDAFEQYNAHFQKALDNMKANNVDLWDAPEELRKEINQPKYAKAAYDSWYERAKEVGFDGPAYIAKVREVLGKTE